MIDAIWFVFWVLIVPCAIVGWVEFLWSVYRDSRSTVRRPRSMARKLTPHEYSLKWKRAEWERRRRERTGCDTTFRV